MTKSDRTAFNASPEQSWSGSRPSNLRYHRNNPFWPSSARFCPKSRFFAVKSMSFRHGSKSLHDGSMSLRGPSNLFRWLGSGSHATPHRFPAATDRSGKRVILCSSIQDLEPVPTNPRRGSRTSRSVRAARDGSGGSLRSEPELCSWDSGFPLTRPRNNTGPASPPVGRGRVTVRSGCRLAPWGLSVTHKSVVILSIAKNLCRFG